MARQTQRQKETVGRVMHEFKHKELESGGRKVRNPRQAVAIALSEAGASNRQSPAENRKRRSRTEEKERRGQTAKQVKEGGRGTPAKSGSKTSAGSRSTAKQARPAARTPVRSTARPTARAVPRGRAEGGTTRAQLYAEAQRRGLSGCSRMSKAELQRTLSRH